MSPNPPKETQEGKSLQSGTRHRLEEAYRAAFRPLILATHLHKLRSGQTTPAERKETKEIVKIALLLHLPLPRHYTGDTVAFKRLALAKAEATLGCISPILEAVRRRLKIPHPTEKTIPIWAIRSYQPPKEIRIEKTRKTPKTHDFNKPSSAHRKSPSW